MWMRAAVVALSVVAWTGSARAAEPFLDRLVAEVAGAVVTATDVALGRALGLFGLTPAVGPLSVAEIQRYVDGQLLVREAARIGVEDTAAQRAEAWAALTERAGGAGALIGWLTAADVDVPWAWRLADEDLRMRLFVELRFRALAFISEADLAAALGPGTHDESAREAMRTRLEAEAARRQLAEWLADARARASIRLYVSESVPIPNPLPGFPEPS
jgi:hypothetical protein